MYFDTRDREFLRKWGFFSFAVRRSHLFSDLLDDQQSAYGYDYSAAQYEDPSAYGQQPQAGAYDASSYNQQSYGSNYGSYDTAGDGGRSQRYGGDHSASYRERDSGRDNDRYGDSRGSYSRRDNYQDQPPRQDEGTA